MSYQENTTMNQEPQAAEVTGLPDQLIMIEKLKEKRSFLESEILAVQYQVLYDTNPNPVVAAALRASLEQKQKEFSTLEKSLALLTKVKKKVSSKEVVDMQKTSLRVAATLKKFKQSLAPEVFWHQFQQGVKTYHLNDCEGVMVLHSLVTEELIGMPTMSKNARLISR